MTKRKITVLKGGISSEREVSLRTGAAVETALMALGFEVESVDVKTTDLQLKPKTEAVFICLHGTFGEDGDLQAKLESQGIPFTGSSSEACRLAFNKLEAKKKFAAAGVPTPRGSAWFRDTEWPVPCVLKPVAEGSSVGVSIVRSERDYMLAKEEALASGRMMMVEDLIGGREVTVGILADSPLPVVEVRTKEGFFDYTNKYTAGKTEHLCPADFPQERTLEIQSAALAAHRALGCEVYSRVDVMVPETGPVQVLEVNTIPGMTEISLLPDAARAAGINFNDLCRKILELSLELRS
jgi:D-alanine-D-alanine ligase